MRLPSGDNATDVTVEKLVSGGMTETQSGTSLVFRKNNNAATITAMAATDTAVNATAFHLPDAANADAAGASPAERIHSRASIKSDAAAIAYRDLSRDTPNGSIEQWRTKRQQRRNRTWFVFEDGGH